MKASLKTFFLIFLTSFLVPITNAGSHSHPTESDKTEVVSKKKKKRHNKIKLKRKRHKNKGFFRSIFSILLLLLIVCSGLILLILPWFISLSIWFFIGVFAVLLITALLLAALNEKPSGPGWLRGISKGIQGCLSSLVLILAIGAIIILTIIAIFGPIGIAYLGALLGMITWIANISENIADKKRKKRIEKRELEKQKESADPN